MNYSKGKFYLCCLYPDILLDVNFLSLLTICQYFFWFFIVSSVDTNILVVHISSIAMKIAILQISSAMSICLPIIFDRQFRFIVIFPRLPHLGLLIFLIHFCFWYFMAFHLQSIYINEFIFYCDALRIVNYVHIFIFLLDETFLSLYVISPMSQFCPLDIALVVNFH